MSPKRTLRSFDPAGKFVQLLRGAGVEKRIVQNTIESGYCMRSGSDGTVSDLMYGNKLLSGSFEFEAFLRYLLGDKSIEPAPPFVEITVRSRNDIQADLAEPHRQRYIRRCPWN